MVLISTAIWSIRSSPLPYPAIPCLPPPHPSPPAPSLPAHPFSSLLSPSDWHIRGSTIKVPRRPDGLEWVLSEGRHGRVLKALKDGLQASRKSRESHNYVVITQGQSTWDVSWLSGALGRSPSEGCISLACAYSSFETEPVMMCNEVKEASDLPLCHDPLAGGCGD